jgi:predicted dinucleotide-binding enzyme
MQNTVAILGGNGELPTLNFFGLFWSETPELRGKCQNFGGDPFSPHDKCDTLLPRAGPVGCKLATALACGGWAVIMGSRNPTSSKSVAAWETACRTAQGNEIRLASNTEAVRNASLVLLAFSPQGSLGDVRSQANSIEKTNMQGKVVIDCTNPLGSASLLRELAAKGTSVGEQFAAFWPDALVYKGLNTTAADQLGKAAKAAAYGKAEVSMLYAGPNDAKAKQRVEALIRSLGFRPVHAGPISNSFHLESIASLYVNMRYGDKTHERPFAFNVMEARQEGPPEA